MTPKAKSKGKHFKFSKKRSSTSKSNEIEKSFLIRSNNIYLKKYCFLVPKSNPC